MEVDWEKDGQNNWGSESNQKGDSSMFMFISALQSTEVFTFVHVFIFFQK